MAQHFFSLSLFLPESRLSMYFPDLYLVAEPMATVCPIVTFVTLVTA